ncbi:uncharacterized protein LOC116159566 isoform X1 [Photinus pyralis]|uniref:uncharacterized protein LOC116159566 isoform X1 n=1 Tax=Photinus pyralis TaxID=7054 RepID=UPI0012675D32|nr:uncharacterized protein LOC116159566 isoform X1 [Photinus pyralis]XP_031328434.1 uncharacterized protein LOC116159566 isoform X1 [Photinus pyralis]XP_031328435.1 uncharacterized protein LOC116159566 isoform X1 [Photinus pyralis]XP_031328436.1 uncharacterized protein LOC116159566 isoform X1 [Photinus pyralis]
MLKRRKGSVGKRQMYRRIANEFKVALLTDSTSVQQSLSKVQNKLNSSDCQRDQEHLSVTTDFDLSSSPIEHSSLMCELQENSDLGINSSNNIDFVTTNGLLDDQNTFQTQIIEDNMQSNNDNRDSCSMHSNVDSNNINSKLRLWATQHHITHSAINDLLKILAPHHSELPLCSKTLLATPLRTTTTRNFVNGEYCHLGLVEGLKKQIVKHNCHNLIPTSLALNFNIDGIPLFKSNRMQLWPILCSIFKFENDPFAVGIFAGSSKPTPIEEYLENFVSELKDLLERGFTFNKIHYTVTVRSIVCDAPARAFLKCIKSHSGYSSCDKCTVAGDYYNGRVILKELDCPKRTDESFCNKVDEDHHTGDSPLLKLNIGMVTAFPTDYMHCVCLGVVRKLLNTWISGDLRVRLSNRTVSELSQRLVSLAKCIPVEIKRKPRSLSELSYWKATEFRSFVLYIGPIVLKNKIDIAIYDHFLLLHCAMQILLCADYIKQFGLSFPRTFLYHFVKHCKRIYTLQFYIYNIHPLLHITDDAERFGDLNSISSFPYENYLGKLKALVRSANKPLQQIQRRLHEMFTIPSSLKKDIQCHMEHQLGPILNINFEKQYKKIQINDFTLSIKSHCSADSYFITKNGLVVEICNFLYNPNSNITILGKEYKCYQSFYSYPIDSKLLNIFEISDKSELMSTYSINDILGKCTLLISGSSQIALPLLHTL